MASYKDYFKGKKITLMGLGVLGRGIKVTKFLAECGAELIVTDLKNEKDLAPALKELKKYKGIEYVLGRHRLSDFDNRDMIIRAANVPLKSEYIDRARQNGIPIEMDASLFAKLAHGVEIIGITGTRGKSTVSHLIYHILEENRKSKGSKKPANFLAGNVRGEATLPLLKKVKKGDRVILELDSWQLQGFGDAKMSPHISVFTNFYRDHQNYYPSMKEYFLDKANIFRYQKEEQDFLIIGQSAFQAIQKYWKEKPIPGTVALARPSRMPRDLKLVVPGEHMRENAALAMQVGEIMGIEAGVLRRALESFKGVEGRLQLVKSKGGVDIYNDNNATSPEATIAALAAFEGRTIILIAGGADKELEFGELGEAINKRVKSLVLLSGSATTKLRRFLNIPSSTHDSLESALREAWDEAEAGDVLLFSPGAASFGLFKNEYERNDLFLELVSKL